MAQAPQETELLRIAKNDKAVNDSLKWGASLHHRTGLTIDSLIEITTRDRILLAKRILVSARHAISSRPRQNRLAVARAYYSMYHAARAVVFFRVGGDDFQEHSELPKHFPGDFPNRANWENDLKNARLERNRADYDPYPRGDARFRKTADNDVDLARQFLSVAIRYLRSKGCTL